MTVLTHLEQVFPGCPAAVAEVRRFVAEPLRRYGFGTRLDDALLCVSELATNAIKHTTSGHSTFVVALDVDDAGGARVSVVDQGAAGVPVVQVPSSDAEGGRGLLLVNVLADGVGHAMVPGGRQATWFALRRPPEPPEPLAPARTEIPS
ncbi:ATP-binding protein [Bailinhaonella thermotolerans]|uniref:ATP-binding protein n=1 Tax=Bailinhaonella thermotolerans TaxID=1070861 RepID=A0A3A4A481_9ACTN|nr:ATP-binding protein [Bailinhaonella thermotolerans]RJL20196.1 ATP-binding protein [Bailinhaonella thermotolerans]